MGTPSTTTIFEGKKAVASIYQQCDGYPSSAGMDLAKFMARGLLVNGLSGVPPGYTTVFNGMGCLAAALVAKLKDSPGRIYLIAPPGDGWSAAYTYEVRGGVNTPFEITCREEGRRKALFKGNLIDFTKFCASSKD